MRHYLCYLVTKYHDLCPECLKLSSSNSCIQTTPELIIMVLVASKRNVMELMSLTVEAIPHYPLY